MKIRLSMNGRKRADGRFDWSDALIDSFILAMINFFSTLAGTSAAGIPGPATLYAAGISAALQFFVVLGIKRGLIKPELEGS